METSLYKFENNQIERKNITFRLATGYYYQPPFYRAARYLDGSINPAIRAQKSIHIVAGGDLVFNMWNRNSNLDLKYIINSYKILFLMK